MDVKKYIASGILELYVAGELSEEQNLEVHQYALQYPEIKTEIEAIESAVLELTKSVSPGLSSKSFENVKKQLGHVIPLEPEASRPRAPFTSYIGWAASILFALGALWLYFENTALTSEIEVVTQEKQSLEEEIKRNRNAIVNSKELLNALRAQSVEVIALGGQTVAPDAYAKVYWNKGNQSLYVDAQGLPKPPTGYAYQLWSLTLNPLTPTSIGLLEKFAENEEQIFEFDNPNASEAFGITLEPEGGSESPTLEQLYTLGAVGP
ncbi:MAG: anti-sigma factor domain-containing protein [Croceivirga sp.]